MAELFLIVKISPYQHDACQAFFGKTAPFLAKNWSKFTGSCAASTAGGADFNGPSPALACCFRLDT
jgi:hypothetical protein